MTNEESLGKTGQIAVRQFYPHLAPGTIRECRLRYFMSMLLPPNRSRATQPRYAPLVEWLDDKVLLSVAAENNLSETAYFVPRGEHYELRWFTPRCEVKLCGHATLASGFVLMQILALGLKSVRFETRYSGTLTVSRDSNMFAMDFPSLAHVAECESAGRAD